MLASTVLLLVSFLPLLAEAGIESCSSCIKEYTCEDFKKDYDKKYTKEEAGKRCKIFNQNLDEINDHNQMFEAGNVSYTLGISEFSDLSVAESSNWLLRRCEGNGPDPHIGCTPIVFSKEQWAPSSYNWVKEGVVTPVKTQGECGSCWAFTTAASIEGQMGLWTGHITSLSVQQLVDCVPSMHNAGCEGGLREIALANLSKSGGLMSEESYPYEEKKGKCRFQKDKVVARFGTCYKINPRKDEDVLKVALYKVGPIAASVWTTHKLLQYRGGVFEDNEYCNPYDTDHAMLLVGYGRQWGKDYWLLKNSWGPNWGEKGYLKLRRNKNNHCGIGLLNYFPSQFYDMLYNWDDEEGVEKVSLKKSSEGVQLWSSRIHLLLPFQFFVFNLFRLFTVH